MKDNIQIQSGLVYVCGPTASGKTTLAKRIIERAPYPHKTLISMDQRMDDFLREAGLPAKMAEYGLDPTTQAVFQQWLISKMIAAMDQEDGFLVNEGVCVRPEDMILTLQLLPKLGLRRPVTVIKLYPETNLHLEFVNKRRHSKRPVPPQIFMSQRKGLAFMQRPLFEDLTWVREYLIEDPRQIELEFVDLGEYTPERLAALHAYSDQGIRIFS